jgi:hypothetical protein
MTIILGILAALIAYLVVMAITMPVVGRLRKRWGMPHHYDWWNQRWS